jgi:ribonuclease HIII
LTRKLVNDPIDQVNHSMNVNSCDRLSFERELWQHGLTLVAGVDEAGRGPLAGPVVAAAVILPQVWQDGGFDEPRRRDRACEFADACQY